MSQWERLDSDTPKSFEAFCLYRDMGAERSLQKTLEALGRPQNYKRTLETWSADHNWVARAAAYDKHLDSLVLEKNQHEWLERKTLQKEREWGASDLLMRLADEMSQFPLTDSEESIDLETGDTVRLLSPKFTIRDIPRLQLAASTLGRRATGLEHGEDLLELEEGVALLVEFVQIIKEEVKDAATLERLEQRFSRLLGEHSQSAT